MTELVTADEARARADRIRAGFLAVADWLADVRGAYAARDWVALGYSSWHEYLAGEYDNQRVALPVEERREAVAVMTRAGMSARAIAPVVGVSEATVRRDVPRSTASNDAVEERPARVQSLDGRSRPAYQPPHVVPPAVRPQPRRAEPQIVAPATDNRPDVAEAIDRYIEGDVDLARARQVKAWFDALRTAQRWREFAVADVVDALSAEDWETSGHLVDGLAKQIDEFRSVRPGRLRVMNGGSR